MSSQLFEYISSFKNYFESVIEYLFEPFYVGYSGQLWPKITKEVYLFLKWDQA